MVSQPRAPSGAGGDGCSSWTLPVRSVARTFISWLPASAAQSVTHWTQVAFEIGADSRASRQTPSMATSTFEMPRSGAQAIPAIATWPAETPPRGVSIRDWVRIGPSFAQPSGTQSR